MFPRGITREAIEALNEIEPHCFETDREEQWFNVGLQYGLNAADANPKSPWISVEDDLPFNHREYVDLKYNSYTCQMLVRCKNGIYSVERMVMIFGRWRWAESNDITHWMPIPKLEEE